MIRDARPEDAPAICRIYNHYVLYTTATFEEEAVDPEVMRDRIWAVVEQFPWLVHQEGDELLGYSYANAWHARPAYRYCVESTIYLSPNATGRGIGKRLYSALLDRLEVGPLHRAVGIVALPNPASVALHESVGFRKVAHLPEVGWKFGRWIDVGWWLRPLGPQA